MNVFFKKQNCYLATGVGMSQCEEEVGEDWFQKVKHNHS